MSKFSDYKKIFIGSIIGIPATVMVALLIAYLKPEPEKVLTELLLQVNQPALTSYSATVKINNQMQGSIFIQGNESKIRDLYFQQKDQLRFVTDLNGQEVTFSGFYKPERDLYAGLIIIHGHADINGGHFTAQHVMK